MMNTAHVLKKRVEVNGSRKEGWRRERGGWGRRKDGATPMLQVKYLMMQGSAMLFNKIYKFGELGAS